VPNEQFHAGEIDVLDPQAQAVENPQPRPIQEKSHQARHAVKAAEHGTHFVAREDNRQPFRTFGADHAFNQARLDLEHISIKEEQCGERLILGGGRNVPVNGQMREKGVDLGGAHLQRVTFVVEEDEALDPIDVGVLGADAVVTNAAGLADPVEQLGRARRGVGRVHGVQEGLGIHGAVSFWD
jgi:hypothetical protein